ncbi:phosphatidylinositol-glycan biosynthesis class F protein [Selaginella moellendorffii]|uniref:phosphatidylinositol-glycan biosynthesis class F protein n=1 Tax=Selaginella moellendorffii TaxID=88036 RepID=UPI000D1CC4FC|nr:phosphatidylinositol-glycan biosynthesis class F protein [Selaginella moellendorffii]XP_024525974.1 phosphatidylinositol-glycan biosynthesis class F protein [Selaginella moellendorffii]XP_024525975.1 phosphatidylinositol-glycan biosynthesis class F protein [Selaginella moellendorffii]XP_024525976.1 phosphatidylinositol-glycan biosynthesis class F protein [Selaginella moellendorffii]|eukprot:XP_024525973.1 phosphatidylinositol-glycan biosynthesis class F protein [Selaginella moellendorffii]
MGVRSVLAGSSALAVGAAVALLHSPAFIGRFYSLILLQVLLFSTIVCDCPAWQALIRGLLCIPLGASAIAFFAITLGAPFGNEFFWPTFYWSFFMSTLMIAPAGMVLGPSWRRWQQVFAFTRPSGSLELLVCVPAHGAAVGAWIGAWPMPLDWEREWQQWPISCTYGATGGYLLGSLVTFILFVHKSGKKK